MLGLPAGRLEPGRVFDAFAVDTELSGAIQVWPELDGWDRVFEKVVRGATVSDITQVWVDGRPVAGDG